MGKIDTRNLNEISNVLLELDPEEINVEEEKLYVLLSKLIDEGLAIPLSYPIHENVGDYSAYNLLKELKYWINLFFTDKMINSKHNIYELINLANKYEREVIRYESTDIHKD